MIDEEIRTDNDDEREEKKRFLFHFEIKRIECVDELISNIYLSFFINQHSLFLFQHLRLSSLSIRKKKRAYQFFICVVQSFSRIFIANSTSMSDNNNNTTPVVPTEQQSEPQINGKNRFEGDGLTIKGKLIGMEDLSVDRDEKICLDSMFKLKAVVKARGEHKQRIQIQLTMSAVKIIDEITKVGRQDSMKNIDMYFELIRHRSHHMKSNAYRLLLLIHEIIEHLDMFSIRSMIDINSGRLKQKNRLLQRYLH